MSEIPVSFEFDEWPIDGEPIKTDDDWCFDCDNPLDLCECEDDLDLTDFVEEFFGLD